jgi:O-antigen/teichoic acid export membrane protein
MALSWPLYAVVAAFAPVLLQVFGARFADGSGALMILVAGMVFALGVGNVTSVLLMAGRSRWNLLNVALALLTDLVLNLILIPRLGIEGAAIAWVAAIVVDNTAALIEVKMMLRLDPFGRGYAVVALSAVACFAIPGLAVRAIFGASLTTLLLFLAVAGPAYGVVLWRTRRTLHLPVVWQALASRRRPSGTPAAVVRG